MRKQTKQWTIKNESKIRICDMSDSHLLNAIALLERYGKAKANDLICEGFAFLGTLQGEMAIMSVEQDLDHLMDYGLAPCQIHPLYKNLLKDKERRAWEKN